MKRLTVTLTCSQCGRLFHPQYGREETSAFCSNSCYLRHRWGTTPQNRCRLCGADISQTGKRRQKYCSFECRVNGQAGQARHRALIRYGKNGAYRARRVPEHPKADCKGYVMEHRLVMEQFLGRMLRSDEIVHHKDGNPANNALSNLELMLKTEHDSLHSVERWSDGRMARLPA